MMGQLAHDNNHVPVISTVGAGSARPMETKQMKQQKERKTEEQKDKRTKEG